MLSGSKFSVKLDVNNILDICEIMLLIIAANSFIVFCQIMGNKTIF